MPALELEPPLDPCRSYSFLYPDKTTLEPRRLLVMRVCDVNEGFQPNVEWLVTGFDLDRQCEQSFRFDAMQQVQPLGNRRPASWTMMVAWS